MAFLVTFLDLVSFPFEGAKGIPSVTATLKAAKGLIRDRE